MKNRREVTLEEMRTIQLDILDKIHDYCEKNNLRYSLSGGTLLGAVRHQGYIPWDDDIDIMMPRPDYEKFFENFNGIYKDLTAQYYKNDKAYFFFMGKVYNNRTVMIEKGPCTSRTGVYVDVFPIDGLPDTKDEMEKYRNTFFELREELKRTTQYYKINNSLITRLKYYVKILIYPSRLKTIEKFYNIIDKYKYGKCKNSGVAMGQYGLKEWLKKEVFENYVELPFENKLRKCIAGYDMYLSSLYGNYMQLPPENERKRHHLNPAFWK